MTTVLPCTICGSSAKQSDDGEYVRCVKCGVVRTKYDYNPHLYRTGYAETYVKYSQTPTNTPLNLFRLGLVSRWLREDQKLLDFGCCIGEFIRFAEPHYKCIGFEPNTVAATMARRRCNSKIITKLKVPEKKVSCVTLFDVLEHIADPKAVLRFLCRDLLSPDGVIVLTTPNVGVIPPWADELLRKWKHYKPEEHLFLYTERGLEMMFEELGLECIHTGLEESDIRPGNPNGDILTFVGRKKHG
jgi:SAM-dependent methyltransferase